VRGFVGEIYSFAVKNPAKFSGPLKPARKKPGKHIGAVVSDTVGKELTRWAKNEKTSRGLWCCYLLEKALQDRMLEKIFGGNRET
jgi:hypothetical protein